jgi:hypothetical protein
MYLILIKTKRTERQLQNQFVKHTDAHQETLLQSIKKGGDAVCVFASQTVSHSADTYHSQMFRGLTKAPYKNGGTPNLLSSVILNDCSVTYKIMKESFVKLKKGTFQD